MKLKFKNQDFQEAATAAVCDVFEGQPYHNPNVYMVDPGRILVGTGPSKGNAQAARCTGGVKANG
jgi:restriction endonuclease